LSFEDWLYRQAEKNAHNEILAFLVILLGVNLLVGGLVITIIMAGQPILFPFITQHIINMPIATGLILTDAGFSIIFAGFVLVIHYDKQRSWNLKEIDKSAGRKNWKVAIKTANEMLEEMDEDKKKS
jgi:vacuolar-type H+-ATPase subunit I/STV1